MAITINRWTLINALQIAAEQYEADAVVHSQPPKDGLASQATLDRLSQQLSKQARDVRYMMADIERQDRITLTD